MVLQVSILGPLLFNLYMFLHDLAILLTIAMLIILFHQMTMVKVAMSKQQAFMCKQDLEKFINYFTSSRMLSFQASLKR